MLVAGLAAPAMAFAEPSSGPESSVKPARPASDESLLLSGWKLFWNDEFSGSKVDTAKWSVCERGTPDWNNTMSPDPRLYVLKNGILQLRGIRNDRKDKDKVEFITGGIQSKGKFEFKHGKVVIRARFKSAKGAWPALWMLGTKGQWPRCGEIDLMEHLNFDNFVYQTIHSHWANEVDKGKSIPKGATAKINPEDFNTYGAEWGADSIVFTVNGSPTLTYPRDPSKGATQWPFNNDFYLILSMQIGGKWVGPADPTHYPAWLEVDWVRVYKPAPKS